MIIIPAIDIIEGKCVRLTQGDYAKKTTYSANPVEIAKEFESAGFTHLHLVDLDGAKNGKVTNYKTLEQIAKSTNLFIEFGGGIKTNEDLEIVFQCGAQQAIIGSVAIKNKALFIQWVEEYGNEKIILGADVKNENIVVSGWLENTNINLFEFLESLKLLIKRVICTDISKDGMLEGTSKDLYEKLIKRFPALNFTVSGGISSIDEISYYNNLGVHSVIIGKALYERKINLQELKPFLST